MDDQLRFEELLNCLWEQELDEQRATELAELLAREPRFRMAYVEAVHSRISLIGLCRSMGTRHWEARIQELVDSSDGQTCELAARDTRTPSSRSRIAAASLLAATLLVLGFSWHLSQLPEPNDAELPRTVAEHTAGVKDLDSAEPGIDQNADNYVALISGMSEELQWSGPRPELDFLMRVKANEEFKIEKGIVQLRYFSGAKVVLEGPVHFVVTGLDSGRLVRGQFAGEVSDGDFKLDVPGAEVIDLGTAFGVTVDDSQDTQVYVFDGEVRVAGRTSSAPEKVHHLTEGMSVHVGRDGKVVPTESSLAREVVREMSWQSAVVGDSNELSLVHLLNTSGAQSAELSSVIDPVSGARDQRPWIYDYGPGDISGDSAYHSVPWHAAVDGVFVPTVKGRDVQIDSSGTRVNLPASNGQTWGPLWSRCRLDAEYTYSQRDDFWGTDTLPVLVDRLKRSRHGLVGVHANVGITLNLEAIRERIGRDVHSFQAVVANINNLEDRISNGYIPNNYTPGKKYTADCRLYVDGVLRANRTDFGREDGDESLSAEIDTNDRFLTIAITDGASGSAYDHIVLIDPVFKLGHASQSPSTPSNKTDRLESTNN